MFGSYVQSVLNTREEKSVIHTRLQTYRIRHHLIRELLDEEVQNQQQPKAIENVRKLMDIFSLVFLHETKGYLFPRTWNHLKSQDLINELQVLLKQDPLLELPQALADDSKMHPIELIPLRVGSVHHFGQPMMQ